MLVSCWQRGTGRPVCKMMALEFVLVVCLRHTHAQIREVWRGGGNLVNMYLPVENLGFRPHTGRQADAICIIKIIYFFATHTYKDILGLICII